MRPSPITLRDVADETADLAPIDDAIREAFGAKPSLNAEGDHVLGFSGAAPHFSFSRHHDGRSIRTSLEVANVCQPALDPANADALVVDRYHRVLSRVATDGSVRRVGVTSPDLRPQDLRALADGTLAVTAHDGRVAFYLPGEGGALPTPLIQVPTGIMLPESYAIPGVMALLVADGDSTLTILGVRRDGARIEVRRLARHDDLLLALPFFILDDEGRENRLPSRAAVFESAKVKTVDGVPEALARFGDFALLPSEPAPPLLKV